MAKTQRVRKLKRDDYTYLRVYKISAGDSYYQMPILESKGKIHEKLIDGKWVVHREDGPALEFSGGGIEYYIDGKSLTKEEFWGKTSKLGKILFG